MRNEQKKKGGGKGKKEEKERSNALTREKEGTTRYANLAHRPLSALRWSPQSFRSLSLDVEQDPT